MEIRVFNEFDNINISKFNHPSKSHLLLNIFWKPLKNEGRNSKLTWSVSLLFLLSCWLPFHCFNISAFTSTDEWRVFSVVRKKDNPCQISNQNHFFHFLDKWSYLKNSRISSSDFPFNSVGISTSSIRSPSNYSPSNFFDWRTHWRSFKQEECSLSVHFIPFQYCQFYFELFILPYLSDLSFEGSCSLSMHQILIEHLQIRFHYLLKIERRIHNQCHSWKEEKSTYPID